MGGQVAAPEGFQKNPSPSGPAVGRPYGATGGGPSGPGQEPPPEARFFFGFPACYLVFTGEGVCESRVSAVKL